MSASKSASYTRRSHANRKGVDPHPVVGRLHLPFGGHPEVPLPRGSGRGPLYQDRHTGARAVGAFRRRRGDRLRSAAPARAVLAAGRDAAARGHRHRPRHDEGHDAAQRRVLEGGARVPHRLVHAPEPSFPSCRRRGAVVSRRATFAARRAMSELGAALLRLDVSILQSVNHGWSSPPLDAFFSFVTEQRNYALPGALLAVYLWMKKGLRGRLCLLTLLLGVAVSDPLSSRLIKPMVHRVRPCAADRKSTR